MQQQTAMQRTEDYELRHHRKDGSQQVLHSTLSMTQLEPHMYGDVPRPGGGGRSVSNEQWTYNTLRQNWLLHMCLHYTLYKQIHLGKKPCGWRHK